MLGYCVGGNVTVAWLRGALRVQPSETAGYSTQRIA